MNSHKKHSALRMLPIVLLTVAMIAGCSDMGDPVSPYNNGGNGGNNPPPDTLTWAANILPDIIQPNCASCHGASFPQANLNLTSFDGWMGTNSLSGNPYVVAGEPDLSELVWRVEGTHGLARMPQGGQLVPDDIAAIRTWITQGAKKQ